MNLEQLLEQHLQASAADLPPYPTDVEAIKARGSRRRFATRIMVATGVAAAIVVTVVLVTSFLPPEPDVVQPAPTPTTVPTQPDVPVAVTTLDGVVAFFGEEGLTLQADGVERLIPGDRYYESIYMAISDGAGGLLFQHGIAPPPWGQDSIVRLAAGANSPEVVVSADDSSPGESRLILGLVDGGFAFADYADVGEEIRLTVHIAAVDGSSSRVALDASFPLSVVSTELVAAQGNRIAVVEYRPCAKVHMYDLAGQPVGSPATLECDITPDDAALSPDGSQLLVVGSRDSSSVLLKLDTSTGAVVETLEVGDVWAVAWDSDQEALVVGSAGAGRIRFGNGNFEAMRDGMNFRLGSVGRVVLADDATTGSGLNELPCEVIPVPDAASSEWMAGADQAVVETWQELRNLAAACEWEQLSDIAEQDQTSISFGGPIRLAKLWVLEANAGSDSGRALLDVTSLPPARTPDGWVWPAVSFTGSDADWQTLIDGGVLTAVEVAQMKDGGYLGFRVGIADDGTWQFGIAGD